MGNKSAKKLALIVYFSINVDDKNKRVEFQQNVESAVRQDYEIEVLTEELFSKLRNKYLERIVSGEIAAIIPVGGGSAPAILRAFVFYIADESDKDVVIDASFVEPSSAMGKYLTNHLK